MLSDIFPVSNIVLNLESEDKDEAFEELIEVLVSEQPNINRSEALNALQIRESKMSTGIMPGIAVPHAISTTVKGVVGAIGVSKTGIDYGSLDDKPVHVIFMLLFAPDETERHLQIMKQFAGLLQYPEFCNGLVKKNSPQEIYDAICACESAMEKSF